MDKKKRMDIGKGKRDRQKKTEVQTDDDVGSLLELMKVGGGQRKPRFKECVCLPPVETVSPCKSRVMITGKIGVTEDDRYVLKYAATVNGTPVATNCFEQKTNRIPLSPTLNCTEARKQEMNATQMVKNEQTARESCNCCTCESCSFIPYPDFKSGIAQCDCEDSSFSASVSVSCTDTEISITYVDKNVQCDCLQTRVINCKEIGTDTNDQNAGSRGCCNPMVLISVYPKQENHGRHNCIHKTTNDDSLLSNSSHQKRKSKRQDNNGTCLKKLKVKKNCIHKTISDSSSSSGFIHQKRCRISQDNKGTSYKKLNINKNRIHKTTSDGSLLSDSAHQKRRSKRLENGGSSCKKSNIKKKRIHKTTSDSSSFSNSLHQKRRSKRQDNKETSDKKLNIKKKHEKKITRSNRSMQVSKETKSAQTISVKKGHISKKTSNTQTYNVKRNNKKANESNHPSPSRSRSPVKMMSKETKQKDKTVRTYGIKKQENAGAKREARTGSPLRTENAPKEKGTKKGSVKHREEKSQMERISSISDTRPSVPTLLGVSLRCNDCCVGCRGMHKPQDSFNPKPTTNWRAIDKLSDEKQPRRSGFQSFRDSIDITHRREDSDLSETHAKSNISGSSGGNYGSITTKDKYIHFNGDLCNVPNPVIRDKEIRELMGLQNAKE